VGASEQPAATVSGPVRDRKDEATYETEAGRKMSERRCDNCVNFQTRKGVPDKGECRCKPPTVMADWPIVKADDWCGAFAVNLSHVETGVAVQTAAPPIPQQPLDMGPGFVSNMP
jgi:hypothetical protein